MSATTAAPATAIRRVALPVTEPAYEDRPDDPPRPPHPGPHGGVRTQGTQGSLALSYLLPSGVPAVPEVATSLRLVDLPRGGDTGPRPGSTEPAIGAARRPPTGAARLPDPHRWSARLAQGIVEVLHGHRPPQQLVRWTDESVYAVLARHLAARRPSTGSSRPLVRSIRVCEPRDGVVEVSVVVHAGHRYRALAMRLEGLDGRWCCTVLDIL